MSYQYSKMRHKDIAGSYSPFLPDKRHGYLRKDGARSTTSTFSAPFSLMQEFRKVCHGNGVNMSEAFRGFMADYVKVMKK